MNSTYSYGITATREPLNSVLDNGKTDALIKNWFSDQLDSISNENAIIILISCFSLIEKCYRYKCKDADETIGNKDAFFRYLAENLGILEKSARVFWQNVRNGMAHYVMPYSSDNNIDSIEFSFGFSYCVMITGKTLQVNPKMIAAKTKEMLNTCEQMWNRSSGNKMLRIYKVNQSLDIKSFPS